MRSDNTFVDPASRVSLRLKWACATPVDYLFLMPSEPFVYSYTSTPPIYAILLFVVARAAPTNTAVGRVGTATMSAHPSLVKWKKLRFVIMDAPKANNLHLYIRELKKQNVVCVVRVCEPTYPASEVEAAGIKVSA